MDKRIDKINRSLAQEQVDLLYNYYDVDTEYMVDELRGVLEQYGLSILKSVVRGRLSIDEVDGKLVITQYLEKPVEDLEKITYNEMNSLASKAVERAKTKVEQVHGVLGALSKKHPRLFTEQMSPVDKSTAEDLGNYFLYL